jgi:hypothetical protein
VITDERSKRCWVCGGVMTKRPKMSWEDWRQRKACGRECQKGLEHPWRSERRPLQA